MRGDWVGTRVRRAKGSDWILADRGGRPGDPETRSTRPIGVVQILGGNRRETAGDTLVTDYLSSAVYVSKVARLQRDQSDTRTEPPQMLSSPETWRHSSATAAKSSLSQGNDQKRRKVRARVRVRGCARDEPGGRSQICA